MWRDRTNLYVSYRQSYTHHPIKKPRISSHSNGYNSGALSERQGLMSTRSFEDDGDEVIEMDLLPPRWLDISDEVTEYLGDIVRKSQKLEKLHQQHVLPGFNDEDIKIQEETEIEILTQDITKKFHDCQRAIQRVESIVRESKTYARISKEEEIMARNIQISLAGKVQEASAKFRKKQSVYLKKLRDTSGINLGSSLDNISTNASIDPYSQDPDADKSHSQLTLQKLSVSNDVVISQREREITEIGQGIIELADIFKELQIMVIDQGTMMDRIDYNIERMAIDVKAADKEMNVASSYQKRGTRRRTIFLLILLVIAMFILLIVKPKNHSRSSKEDG